MLLEIQELAGWSSEQEASKLSASTEGLHMPESERDEHGSM